MKKDVHFKIDEGLLQRLEHLAHEVGLPATRFIETALREYLEEQRKKEAYRITGVNEITGVRMSVSAMYKTMDAAQAALDRIRKEKNYIQNYFRRLQVEKVTI